MRSVGYEQDILLDGSGSKDPDVGENRTGITYTWMCRKDKEEFPSDSGQQDPKAGCWGNGASLLCCFLGWWLPVLLCLASVH